MSQTGEKFPEKEVIVELILRTKNTASKKGRRKLQSDNINII